MSDPRTKYHTELETDLRDSHEGRVKVTLADASHRVIIKVGLHLSHKDPEALKERADEWGDDPQFVEWLVDRSITDDGEELFYYEFDDAAQAIELELHARAQLGGLLGKSYHTVETLLVVDWRRRPAPKPPNA